jgi:hypothetical protein
MPKGIYPRRTTEQNFWKKVTKTDSCWLWTASTQKDGYGHFHEGRVGVVAHRYSYELAKGSIPAGMKLLHTCDVRACVNPDHLKLGTQKDNVMDAVSKGRHCHGVTHGMAKYTAQQIYEVKALLGIGLPPKQVSQETGVKLPTVYDIRLGRAWGSI